MKTVVPDKVDWVMDYYPRRRRAAIRRILGRPALWFWLGMALGIGLGSIALVVVL